MRQIVPLLALGATVLAGRSAEAVIFAPLEPATCPNWTFVNWQYNTMSGDMVPLDDVFNYYDYGNNVDLTIEVTANERVNEFYARFDYLATEPFYDYLQFHSYSPDGNGTDNYYSGSAPWWQGNPTWGGMRSSAPFPQANAFIRFRTDANDNDPGGIFLGYGAVCTRNPGAPVNNAYRVGVQARRHTGVLLGGSDVVYFRFDNGSTRPGQTCSVAHDTFAMQGDAEAGNDFDLYIRCGALPTPTQYDAVDFYGPGVTSTNYPTNSGFIHAPSTCPCGTPWYVAVHSYSGQGWFNLWNQKHYASEHRAVMRMYTSRNLTPGEMSDVFVPTLAEGMAHFFGANEGTKFYDNFSLEDLDPTHGPSWVPGWADVRIWNYTGRPNADCPSDWYCGIFSDCKVELHIFDDGYGTYEPSTLSHELGHYVNCLEDEYVDGEGNDSIVYCGHSVMGSHWGTQHNYCYCVQQGTICAEGQGDHNKDGDTRGPDKLATWDSTATGAPYTFIETPDNYNFWDFDFHGVYAAPITINHP